MANPSLLPPIPFAGLDLPVATATLFQEAHEGALITALPKVLGPMLTREGWSFSCASSPDEIAALAEETGRFENKEYDLTVDEVVSPKGMLPLLLDQASDLMRWGLRTSPTIAWGEDVDAFCNCVPSREQKNSAPLGWWMLFCHYSLEQLVLAHPDQVNAGQPVSLTDWRTRFLSKRLRSERPASNRETPSTSFSPTTQFNTANTEPTTQALPANTRQGG